MKTFMLVEMIIITALLWTLAVHRNSFCGEAAFDTFLCIGTVLCTIGTGIFISINILDEWEKGE